MEHESFSASDQPPVYVASADAISDSLRTPDEIISKPGNRVHTNIRLQQSSFFFVLLPLQFSLKFAVAGELIASSSFEVHEINGNNPEIQRKERIFQVRPLAKGFYSLNILKEGQNARTIGVYVDNRSKPLSSADCEKNSVNAVIAMPQSAIWLVPLLNVILMKQNFSMVAARKDRLYLYERRLTMCWNVALVLYSDFNSVVAMTNNVKDASDLMLLFEDEDILNPVCRIDKIFGSFGEVIRFAKKGNISCTYALSYDALPHEAKLVVNQLNAFAQNNNMAICGAKIRRLEENEQPGIDKPSNVDDLERLVIEWLALPSSFTNRKIYLRFAFASSMIATKEMAKQFTAEILPMEGIVHAVTDGSPIYVYISCPIFCAWILSATLDDISAQYSSLLSVQEMFLADLPENNPDLEDLTLEMQSDGVPNRSDKKFNWQKNARLLLEPFCGPYAFNQNCQGCNYSHETHSFLVSLGVCDSAIQNHGHCNKSNCNTKLHPVLKW